MNQYQFLGQNVTYIVACTISNKVVSSYLHTCLYIMAILLMEEFLHQLICGVSHYLQGFIHPRWVFAGFLPSTVCLYIYVYIYVYTSTPATFPPGLFQRPVVRPASFPRNWPVPPTPSRRLVKPWWSGSRAMEPIFCGIFMYVFWFNLGF